MKIAFLGHGRVGAPLADHLQRLGHEVMVAARNPESGNVKNASYPGYDVKPAMMYCGIDAGVKEIVGGLIEQLGWHPLDVGGLEQALHLEHMNLVWVRMVGVQGPPPAQCGPC